MLSQAAVTAMRPHLLRNMRAQDPESAPPVGRPQCPDCRNRLSQQKLPANITVLKLRVSASASLDGASGLLFTDWGTQYSLGTLATAGSRLQTRSCEVDIYLTGTGLGPTAGRSALGMLGPSG